MDEMTGPTPRNASGKSAGLVSHVTGNFTTTSQCNQSFQFGFNTQINNTLVSATSQGRGGSSGSNPRAKIRYRSGSNKNINQKKGQG